MNYLKQDLQRIDDELEMATNLGLVRQSKGLTDDKQRLIVRIQGLEGNNHGN